MSSRLAPALIRAGLLTAVLSCGAGINTFGVMQQLPWDNERPEPDVTLPKRPHHLRFEVGPDVCDPCVLPAQKGLGEAKVEGFHDLLETAFRLGIAPSFQAPKPQADLTLRIVRAEPHVTVASRVPSGDAFSLRSMIRYEAELLDASGRAIARTSGDVAPDSTSPRFSIGAIERLFEEIAERLLTRLPGELESTKPHSTKAADSSDGS